MKNFLLGFSVLFCNALFGISALADDNIANCEIVIMKKITPDEIQNSAPLIATYMPAEDFIFSVFDAKLGHLKTVYGSPIRALMCTRSNVLPTEFDIKLIKTGVPLFLSQNFDSKDSAFMAIQKNDGEFTYDYSGPDLNKDEKNILKAQFIALNQEYKKSPKDSKNDDE
ncbi:MAG: hypothetical protein V3U57_01935 [Robiginitomaculum sp.]